MNNMKLFRFWDLILVLILVVIAWVSFLFFQRNTKGQTAVITKDGIMLYEIELSKLKEPLEIKLNDEYNVIVKLENDGATVLYSDCPDKLCLKTGKITKENQAAICLPARVAVKITSGNDSIDAVTG